MGCNNENWKKERPLMIRCIKEFIIFKSQGSKFALTYGWKLKPQSPNKEAVTLSFELSAFSTFLKATPGKSFLRQHRKKLLPASSEAF
jgi:hypothetical protein